MASVLEILPVTGIGDITPGTDLAATIADAAPWLRDGDVLVVTSKIVSKAEGRLVEIPTDGPEREAAREAILVAETARPVARRGQTRIVQTHHGFVMASAGIDASNVDRSRLVLLPSDPDASARALRDALKSRYGLDVAVIVSDTMGRPWRNGLTDVALGAAGIAALRDHRGEVDPYGNELHITQMAIVDELCAAAELVKGKRDQVPVAVVRGYVAAAGPDEGARVLVRSAASDLFSLGTAEARTAGTAHAATLPDASRFTGDAVDPAAVERALARVTLAPTTTVSVSECRHDSSGLPPGTRILLTLVVPKSGDIAAALVACGADVQRLRASLAAEGLASAWMHPEWPDGAVARPGPGGEVQILAVGVPA
jgi:coenzyme F420-0:L-glutamate ligase/coenzyme F420-1:gamma-L-glutamate ligase